MSDEAETPEPGKRGSEALFFGVVAIVMLAAFAGGAYFLGAFDGSCTKTPAGSPGHSRSPSSSHAHRAVLSRAAAVAVVRKNFRLAVGGQYVASCALESPAYRRFDAGNYSHGSCAAESRAVLHALRSRGLTMTLISTEVQSFGGGQATVLAKVRVGTRPVAATYYLQYHGTKWWITGGDDSGDVGY